jgi:hypothetical protein
MKTNIAGHLKGQSHVGEELWYPIDLLLITLFVHCFIGALLITWGTMYGYGIYLDNEQIPIE